MVLSDVVGNPSSLKTAAVTPLSAEATHIAAQASQPTARPVRLLFVVMSAVAQPGTIDQLAMALAPHQVLVHHDFSQRPNFTLRAPNVVLVPDPKRTGWAEFGFVEGIFHALDYALKNLSFDYVQLLSPTCLPIKPIAAFEQHISQGPLAHFDGLALMQDADVLMSVGYRAFTAQHSLMYRLARRLPNWYYGSSTGRRDEAGVWLRSGQGERAAAALSGWLTKAMSRLFPRHLMTSKALPLYYGSAWFGAQRGVVQGMVQAFAQPRLHNYFSRLCIAEEFLIPSLLMQLTQGEKGPLNHCIQVFEQAHPGFFELQDLALLRASPAFFARKFIDNPLAPVRLRVLGDLVGRQDLVDHAAGEVAEDADVLLPPSTPLPAQPLRAKPSLQPQGGPPVPGLPA